MTACYSDNYFGLLKDFVKVDEFTHGIKFYNLSHKERLMVFKLRLSINNKIVSIGTMERELDQIINILETSEESEDANFNSSKNVNGNIDKINTIDEEEPDLLASIYKISNILYVNDKEENSITEPHAMKSIDMMSNCSSDELELYALALKQYIQEQKEQKERLENKLKDLYENSKLKIIENR